MMNSQRSITEKISLNEEGKKQVLMKLSSVMKLLKQFKIIRIK